MKNSEIFGRRPAIYILRRINDDRLINQWHDDKRTHDKPVLIHPTDIKFGIATDIDERIKIYQNIFGESNIQIEYYEFPNYSKSDLENIESKIKIQLSDYQIKSPYPRGRKREWVANVSYEYVKSIVENNLK